MSGIRCCKCGRVATEEMGWLTTWRLVGKVGSLLWACNPPCREEPEQLPEPPATIPLATVREMVERLDDREPAPGEEPEHARGWHNALVAVLRLLDAHEAAQRQETKHGR